MQRLSWYTWLNFGLALQCLLDNLLLAKDDEGHGLSLQSLRDQLMTLLVAGQETSAILLGWTTAFLAHHPDVQQQAAAEVREVLQGEAPTPENTRCAAPVLMPTCNWIAILLNKLHHSMA